MPADHWNVSEFRQFSTAILLYCTWNPAILAPFDLAGKVSPHGPWRSTVSGSSFGHAVLCSVLFILIIISHDLYQTEWHYRLTRIGITLYCVHEPLDRLMVYNSPTLKCFDKTNNHCDLTLRNSRLPLFTTQPLDRPRTNWARQAEDRASSTTNHHQPEGPRPFSPWPCHLAPWSSHGTSSQQAGCSARLR